MAKKKTSEENDDADEVADIDETDDPATDDPEAEDWDPEFDNELEDDDDELDDDDDDDADEVDSEEGEEALDELEAEELEMLTDDEESETLIVDEAAEMRAIRRAELAMDRDGGGERADDEFLCQGCFLVLKRSQLMDKRKMLCRDCAA